MAGVQALFHRPSRLSRCRESEQFKLRASPSSPQVEGNGCAPAEQWRHQIQPLEQMVRVALEPHLAELQEAILQELKGAQERLQVPQHATAKYKRSRSAALPSNGIDAELIVPQNPKSVPKAHPSAQYKRRWTTSMDLIGGALTTTCLDSSMEDAEPPVSATTSEAREGSDSHRKASRITFVGMEQLTGLDEPTSGATSEEDMPMTRQRTGSDASSVNWRANALDVGECLAAETAAKKGTTSIDSIVALVQAERERWDEEKEALEASVEELKENLRSMQAARSPDAEKQALKREHQELRKAMKARSRFGAWVCERHMKESEDEETDAEKEELRRKISETFVQLRAAKVAMGAASSESDVSPTRRSPGPIIRRRH